MNAEEVHAYIKMDWPRMRPKVLGKLSKRCWSCGISAKIKPFDTVCDECGPYSPTKGVYPFDYLDPHLKNEKRVALFLSGGKDSAYVLDRMTIEYPDIKIVCIFVDNGFSSKVALSNVTKTTQKLGVDLLIVNSAVPVFKKAFREAFKNLGNNGCYGVIDFTDGQLIYSTAMAAAAEQGINTCVSGLSWAQQELILGHKAKVRLDNLVFPLVAWRTREDKIREYVLEKDLVRVSDPLLSNNGLVVTMFALDFMKLGYCSFEPEFCRLVREGKADRETWGYTFEAFEYLTHAGKLDSEVRKVLSNFDLTLEEVL